MLSGYLRRSAGAPSSPSLAEALSSLSIRRPGRRQCAAAVLALLAFTAVSCGGGRPSAVPSPPPGPASSDQGPITAGTVVDIVDGITIDVDVGGEVLRVRYLGLELPTGADSGGSLERAIQFNRFLVEGRRVELEKEVVDTDDRGRLLRYVYVGGEMVNRAVLTNGYARVSSFPPGFKHRSEFEFEEEAAKRDRRGFWESTKSPSSGATPSQDFSGGTLPAPPSTEPPSIVCDSSGVAPRIKGNVDARTGERTYYLPTSLLYATVVIAEADGDRWFCTEDEAVAAGWRKSEQ